MNRNTAEGFEIFKPPTPVPEPELLAMIAQDLEELHRMIGEWVDLPAPRLYFMLGKIDHMKARYGFYVPQGERKARLERQYALKRSERLLGRPNATIAEFDKAFKEEWTPILNPPKPKRGEE